MARYELKLPAMGEGIIEASITRWFVDEGNIINEDEALVEVATDKVDSEIPAPVSGILKKIVYKEGEIPKVGEVIAIIETEKDEDYSEKEISPVSEVREEKIQHVTTADDSIITEIQDGKEAKLPEQNSVLQESMPFMSPFIKSLAKQRGISYQELMQIQGTGIDNRLTKEDLNNYIISGRPFRNYSVKSGIKVKDIPGVQKKMEVANENAEIIEMDRVRKMIAENMLKSKKTAPHVTSFIEADVTTLVSWRESIKKQFMSEAGVNLTYTVLFTEIVARALKEFPRINSSVDGDKILIKKEINIGIATALTNGNLIVSVIKQADKENIRGLAIKISDLTKRARQNKLLPSEIKGSTFTITNIGQYNSLTGTPIINLPEVAILAIGTIKKKPAVINVGGKPGIGIRDIVMLSLTYDHRIIDGALGGSFLNSIATRLENFNGDKIL